MVSDEERIQQIEARRAKAHARATSQIRRLRGRIRKRNRRAATRWKVLAGARQFDLIERGAVSVEKTLRSLDEFLTRPADRTLFGLPKSKQPDGVALAATAYRSGLWRVGRRADDTRRKILAGAMLLDKMERGVFPKPYVQALMDDFLSRETDRALFDLEPLADSGDQAS